MEQSNMLFLLILTAPVVYADQCQDASPSACALLAKGQQNLCADQYIANHTCPKFCGLCPTSVPTVAVDRCEDVDSKGCELLANGKAGGKTELCSDSHIANTTCPKFCGLCPLYCYSCDTPVMDPNNCTTFVGCSSGQVCSSRELRSSLNNGRHEYTFGCVDKKICDGAGFSVPIGKREVDTRDLSISCCDTDMCNLKTALTCDPDLIIMIANGVSTVNNSEYQDAIRFVSDTLKTIRISDSATKVAVLTYEVDTHILYGWGSPQEVDKILQEINATEIYSPGQIRYVPYSYSEMALHHLRENFLQNNNNNRLNHRDVVILLTDGDTSSLSLLYDNGILKGKEQADLLRRDGVRIVLVKIGSAHVMIEDHVDAVINATSYNTLGSQMASLIKSICI